LEKAVQFIKDGFSYRVKKELGSNLEIWQKGFSDHRIRDAADYWGHVEYIRQNPVKKGLAARPEEYEFSSAHAGFDLDEIPQGLKPRAFSGSHGAPEGAPLQSNIDVSELPEGMPLQNNINVSELPEGAALRTNINVNELPEGAPLQSDIKLQSDIGMNELPEGVSLKDHSDVDMKAIRQTKMKSTAA
jgi:hypothetical protein